MMPGMLAPELSSRCESLRILATACDKLTWPFKPRVVGSIPTRLTLEHTRSLLGESSAWFGVGALAAGPSDDHREPRPSEPRA